MLDAHRDRQLAAVSHFADVHTSTVANVNFHAGECVLATLNAFLLAQLNGCFQEYNCSDQPIPDIALSFSSATAGASPSLN
ncbi:hypothetical protein PSAC2689_90014 [Paraburkholderia sacchari]